MYTVRTAGFIKLFHFDYLNTSLKGNLGVTNLVVAQVRLDHMHGFRDTLLNIKGAPVSYL